MHQQVKIERAPTARSFIIERAPTARTFIIECVPKKRTFINLLQFAPYICAFSLSMVASAPLALSSEVSPERTYVVGNREELGRILQKLGCSPLWGPRGFVKKTLDLNPSIQGHGGIALKEGSVLIIPKGCGADGVPPQSKRVSAPFSGPAPAPAPASASAPKRWVYELEPRIYFSAATSTNIATSRSATLVSNLNYGAKALVGYSWQDRRAAGLVLGLNRESYLNQANSSASLPSIDGFARHQVLRDLGLRLSLGVERSFFLRQASASTATIPRAALDARWLFARLNDYSFFAEGALEYRLGGSLSADEKVQRGFGYEGRVDVMRLMRQTSKECGAFGIGLFYRGLNQGFTNFNQTEKAIGLAVSFRNASDSKEYQ